MCPDDGKFDGIYDILAGLERHTHLWEQPGKTSSTL